jgi:hypothetical protein
MSDDFVGDRPCNVVAESLGEQRSTETHVSIHIPSFRHHQTQELLVGDTQPAAGEL